MGVAHAIGGPGHGGGWSQALLLARERVRESAVEHAGRGKHSSSMRIGHLATFLSTPCLERRGTALSDFLGLCMASEVAAHGVCLPAGPVLLYSWCVPRRSAVQQWPQASTIVSAFAICGRRSGQKGWPVLLAAPLANATAQR